MDIVCEVMFTQMTTVGIQKSGEQAIAAIFKELKQLDRGAITGIPVVISTYVSTLSLRGRRALRSVNLRKHKKKKFKS